MNKHKTITAKTPYKANHSTGHITIGKMIRVMVLQKAALVVELIRETEMNLMIITSRYSVKD